MSSRPRRETAPGRRPGRAWRQPPSEDRSLHTRSVLGWLRLGWLKIAIYVYIYIYIYIYIYTLLNLRGQELARQQPPSEDRSLGRWTKAGASKSSFCSLYRSFYQFDCSFYKCYCSLYSFYCWAWRQPPGLDPLRPISLLRFWI